jgi:hypothetical protein
MRDQKGTASIRAIYARYPREPEIALSGQRYSRTEINHSSGSYSRLNTVADRQASTPWQDEEVNDDE